MGDIVPRKELAKQGTQGVGGIVGGVVLLILRGLGPFGWVAGGLLTLGGLALASSKEDRTAGMVTVGAGILTLLSKLPFLGGIAGTLMSIGGIGLLVFGGYSLIKFVLNLRKRR